ncbi:MAG: lauroyl acyltransferase [Rhodospirillales bacterium]|nr:lauroyl acyltransferase [Rhodospirillales bacterium]
MAISSVLIGSLAYRAEAVAAWLLYAVFGLLPVDAASWLGSALGRLVGPHLRVTRTARRNLKQVFPDLNDAELARIISGMWDNLGRTAGEHPHLAKFQPYRTDSRVEVTGVEHVDGLRDDGVAGLFFAGHIANWELSPLAVTGRDVILHLVYRRANNPFFDAIVQKGRAVLGGDLFPKGSEGAKSILRSLRRGEHLAMLVDQKMNDGIPVPFLGRDAMTAPAVAELAYRYDCPLVPARVERLGGARFRVTFYAPLKKPESGDRQTDIAALMGTVNAILGDWIRERPEQWLWVHNRWPPE